MAFWKWFNGVLKEAGIDVNSQNEDKVDEVIHHYIGEQEKYGRCLDNWSKARKQVQDDPKMRKELVKKLKAIG